MTNSGVPRTPRGYRLSRLLSMCLVGVSALLFATTEARGQSGEVARMNRARKSYAN